MQIIYSSLGFHSLIHSGGLTRYRRNWLDLLSSLTKYNNTILCFVKMAFIFFMFMSKTFLISKIVIRIIWWRHSSRKPFPICFKNIFLISEALGQLHLQHYTKYLESENSCECSDDPEWVVDRSGCDLELGMMVQALRLTMQQ